MMCSRQRPSSVKPQNRTHSRFDGPCGDIARDIARYCAILRDIRRYSAIIQGSVALCGRSAERGRAARREAGRIRQDMAGYGGVWRDMAGYGGIWWDMAGYREIPGDTRRCTWI